MKKFTSGFLLVVLSLLFFVSCDLSLKGDEKKLHPDIYVLEGTAEIVSGSGLFSFEEVTADGNNGLASAETLFTVENRGKENLVISSIAISSGDTQDFDLVKTIENKIAPNKSDTFSIKFDPLTPGDKSAVVTITSNDPDKGIFTFHLKGKAIPKIIYNPDINILQGTTNITSGSSAHSFEETVVDGDNGTVSSEVIFTIENLGNSDLDITEISLTSGDVTDFDIINSTTGVITPSASTTFSVIFDPLSEGDKNAIISITSNDPDESSYTLVLTGKGNYIVETIILIDASGSVGQDGWFSEIEFTKSLINNYIPVEDRLGIIVFATQITCPWRLNSSQDRSQIIEKIDSLTWIRGYTHHRSALNTTIEMFKEMKVNPSRRNIIMITDGQSYPTEEDPSMHGGVLAQETRDNLNKINAELFIVGIGEDRTFNKLNTIYNEVSGEYLNVPTFDQLPDAAPTVAEMVNKKN